MHHLAGGSEGTVGALASRRMASCTIGACSARSCVSGAIGLQPTRDDILPGDMEEEGANKQVHASECLRGEAVCSESDTRL